MSRPKAKTAARRGRPPRDLYETLLIQEEAKTPAQLRAADRAWREYEKRRLAAAEAHKQAEIAAGLHPTTAQWLDAHPIMLKMLCDMYLVNSERVREVFAAHEAKVGHRWLSWSTMSADIEGSEYEEVWDNEGRPRGQGRHVETKVVSRPSAIDVDISIAKEVWQSGLDLLEAPPTPVPATAPPKRPTTRAARARSRDASRKRTARAAGTVKPRARKGPRTVGSWHAAAVKALATTQANPKADPNAVGHAMHNEGVWRKRVQKYGAEFVWKFRARDVDGD